MKKILTLAMALTLTVSLAACGNKDKDNNSSGSESSSLSGSILAVGSTALQQLADTTAQKFMDKNSGVSIQVQGGGSGTGLTQVADGQAQIGNSDVFAEEKLDADKAATLVDHQVAVVAMAAVSNKDVGIDGLTKQQLVDIFTGKVTNWKEVGGKDEKIQIINRPSSSGTRATFEKFALGTKTEDLAGSIQEDSSGTVKKLVSETPGAIGYLAMSYLDDSITTLKYDGVEATVDNVANGSYPVWAYEHMYTKGEPDAATKAFLDYIASDEVQNGDVVELGYIPTSKMQVKRDAAGNVTK
ncbi:phosphate ABC transporter substrate-binding protein PstS family protein [Paenibacillus sp. PR3]|uniref:Phosphate-binding protein n=1 Tax=Paenibacillus terricola TaxID=2763503 RepID=A0ABR8N2E8_9BACL|nr:phosphate ABC transporter substrate-binding protein PstS family protein [Paenibacillus terricola]MBD3922323.1 phosphate ABC transporter substrate-binding protein PstS family protein [Paenibacillus terricola]